MAVGFLVLLFWRIKPGHSTPVQGTARAVPTAVSVLLATALVYWPSLRFPLLHDSYGLVYLPSRQSLADVLRLWYVHPTSGDFFFRPLSYFFYWVYAKWAHFEPFRWHLLSVAVHLANTGMVYVLATQLAFGRLGASMAALLFSLHGSRPEAVVWAAARVDVFAAFFVLLTLLAINQLLFTERTQWYIPIVGFAAAAVCCKESAFCLPFLAGAMLFLRNEPKRGIRAVAVLLATCGVAFVYRYWVIGSVGGYGAATGSPAVLHFSLIRTLNALFYRQWALLFFPINWSEPAGSFLRIGLAVYGAALIGTLVWARGQRGALLAALGMTMAAALPVEHMLLIGSDLNGARVLYLPVLGLALFWGLLIEGCRSTRARSLVATGVIALQVAALEHNLRIWEEVAVAAQRSCSYIADEIAGGTTPVAVPDLPFKWRGVYFLSNAFPACVMLNSGGRLHELPSIGDSAEAGVRIYRWNDSAGKLERRR